MNTRTLAKLIVCGGAILVCSGLLEAVVRFGCRYDIDGNCRFRQTLLKPYHVPVRKSRQIIAEYLASNESKLLYDPELGWNQRPSVDHHNAGGFITSVSGVARELPADRLRIALFGGSYTEGTFDGGWWRVLEKTLNDAGVKAEVLNFGVSGYGMDQAYLRWKRDGAPYHPDVVIFGFSAGNCTENMNLLRVIKDVDSNIPFTKPRFCLENGALQLLNMPTPSPEEIPAILDRPASWPLIKYERYYRASDFQMTVWRFSKVLAVIEGKLAARRQKRDADDLFRLGNEPADLALAIIRRFQQEVEQSGSVFCIAHLPHHSELEDLRAAGKFRFQDLLNAVDRVAPTVHTERALLAACGDGPIGAHYVDGHFSPPLHTVAGREIAAFVQEHASAWRRPRLAPAEVSPLKAP
jgi:hypothetical protein